MTWTTFLSSRYSDFIPHRGVRVTLTALSAAVQVLAFVIIGIYVIWLAILSVMAFAEICRMSLHVRKTPAHRIVGFGQAPLTLMAVGAVAVSPPLPQAVPCSVWAFLGDHHHLAAGAAAGSLLSIPGMGSLLRVLLLLLSFANPGLPRPPVELSAVHALLQRVQHLHLAH